MAIKLRNNNYVPGWQLCRSCYEISSKEESDSDETVESDGDV